MPRFLLAWLLSLAAAAIALFLSGLFFSGFHLSYPMGFIWAVVIYAILSGIFSLITLKVLVRHASSVVPLTGLISTFLALWLTSLLTDGLTIDGLSTWILATLLIWILSMILWAIPGPWRRSREERRGDR